MPLNVIYYYVLHYNITLFSQITVPSYIYDEHVVAEATNNDVLECDWCWVRMRCKLKFKATQLSLDFFPLLSIFFIIYIKITAYSSLTLLVLASLAAPPQSDQHKVVKTSQQIVFIYLKLLPKAL